ncbi:MAG: hypothetical protein HY815_10015 [Candidatus Riflebacteria bacterium]|nr:hypothetical protein [Candidatus Riflebacteria bacterium]
MRSSSDERKRGSFELGDEDDGPGFDDLSAAVDAQLALLETGEPASGQSGQDVELPRRLPVTPLPPTPDAEDGAAPIEVVPDQPLQLPLDGASPGSYHFELSRFLMLFLDRFGIQGRLRNGEAVLKLPGGAGPGGQGFPEVRLPLYEERQLEACLAGASDVINPSPLLARCLGQGAHTRLGVSPRLTRALAQTALEATDVELVTVPFVQFNFLTTLRYYRKEEHVISPLFSLDDGEPAPMVEPLLAAELWTGPSVESLAGISVGPEALHRACTKARAAVDRSVECRRRSIQEEIDAQAREAIKILDDYYEEKTRELEDEKRSVYFHLYYFEKEEAIEKQLAGMRREKEERSRAISRFWDVKVSTRLVSMGYFEIPFWTVPGPDGRDRGLDALTGTVARERAAHPSLAGGERSS